MISKATTLIVAFRPCCNPSSFASGGAAACPAAAVYPAANADASDDGGGAVAQCRRTDWSFWTPSPLQKGAAAASSASSRVGTSAKPCPAPTKLDGDATDSLLDVLEGGPSGSEGGGESNGVGPPPSLGSVGGYEGRAGWCCDRRRRQGVGRGAARRRADAPSRPGAAPCAPPARPGAVRCAPPVPSLVLPPPSGFAVLAPSLHSCDAGTTPPCA
eukprot:scaffold4055_cov51-Phaeocystis_antarctica.AAC.2